MIKKDTYGEVVNAPETYHAIATELNLDNSCMVGWTDGLGSHLDILFTLGAVKFGNVQGGIQPTIDLFVSVMRAGAFAFNVEEDDTHPSYYGEKLGLGSGGTVTKIAELINGVKHAFLNLEVNHHEKQSD